MVTDVVANINLKSKLLLRRQSSSLPTPLSFGLEKKETSNFRPKMASHQQKSVENTTQTAPGRDDIPVDPLSEKKNSINESISISELRQAEDDEELQARRFKVRHAILFEVFKEHVKEIEDHEDQRQIH